MNVVDHSDKKWTTHSINCSNSTGALVNGKGHWPKKSTSDRGFKNCAANKKRAKSRVICKECSLKTTL